MLGVKFYVNLSKKKRSVRSEPNMTVSDLEKLRQTHLSKRNLLGFVNGLSDPLGIGSPWYMKQKLLMKKLFELENPLSWDDKVPDANREGWIEVMTEALVEGVLPFPRSTRPEHAIGVGPLVVGFGMGLYLGMGEMSTCSGRWSAVMVEIVLEQGMGILMPTFACLKLGFVH